MEEGFGFVLNQVCGLNSGLGRVTFKDILKVPGKPVACWLFSFMFEIEWLALHIRDDYSHLFIVGDKQFINQDEVNVCMPNAKVCGVRVEPYGCHHTKMIILEHENILRVIITSANLISVDWEAKTQTIWYKDFLKKDPTIKTRASQFEVDFHSYLRSYPSSICLVDKLKLFDFSNVQAHLVGSVPGRHTGSTMHQFGHLRINTLFKNLSIRNDRLYCQFSSLGSVDEKYLNEIKRSFSAKDIALIWPTIDDVRNSVEGWSGGGSLRADLKNMKKVQEIVYSWDAGKSDYNHFMPHMKSYYSLIGESELAWCLVTSANFSKAAWGVLEKKDSQLYIKSYELGILCVPSCSVDIESISLGKRKKDEMVRYFQNFETALPAIENSDHRFVIMPLPFRLIPEKNLNPWVSDVVHKGQDMFGMQLK